MVQQYNFYNLQASFKNFLLAGNSNPVTIKNYLSDLRHFLGWTILKLKIKSDISADNDENCIVKKLNSNLISEYKTYLVDNNIPLKTINRRLSTVRKFCSFCINQGWLTNNPAKEINNFKNEKKSLNGNLLIDQYRDYLSKLNLDNQTVDTQVKNIKEFIEI